jgi:hypothetical protein
VQAAQNSSVREGLVLLHEGRIDPQGGKLIAMIGLKETAASILEDLRLNDAYAGQLGIDSLQARSL